MDLKSLRNTFWGPALVALPPALLAAWVLGAFALRAWVAPATVNADTPPAKPPVEVVQDETPQPVTTPCLTKYYALFETEHGLGCAADPTRQLAFYGPPDAGWFARTNGHFELDGAAVLPADTCTCLAAQSPFEPKPDAWSQPVDQVILDARPRPIQAWVCAKPSCVSGEG